MMDMVLFNPIMRGLPGRVFARRFFGPSLLNRIEDEEGIIRPKVDVTEDEDKFLLTAELPGFKQDEVKIELKDNVLALRAERKEEKEEERDNYRIRERRFGSFVRNFNMPDNIDGANIEAVMRDGILTLTIPKAEEEKPKMIEVKVH